MADPTRTVTPDRPGRPDGVGAYRCAETGEALDLPPGWALLAPGDAAHTRRVEQAGPHWVVEEQKGRRTFSRGVLAPAERIERFARQLAQERASPAYAHRLQASRTRRAKQETEYVDDFREAVLAFLRFAPVYRDVADAVADQVTAHTTPVGSGTVGRTRRIPIGERAASAVIAWMRHQTTSYDQLEIARVRGKRREVRRKLAQRSRELLERFRRGEPVDVNACRLHRAVGLARTGSPESPAPGVVGGAPMEPRVPAQGARPSASSTVAPSKAASVATATRPATWAPARQATPGPAPAVTPLEPARDAASGSAPRPPLSVRAGGVKPAPRGSAPAASPGHKRPLWQTPLLRKT